GIESEQHIHQRRSAEAERHERPRIRSIAQETIREFRDAVKHAMQSQKQTKLSFLEAEAALHYRHRDAEVLANEVESRIANDRAEQDALLPMTVAGSDLRGVGDFCRCGPRRREEL